MKNSMISIIVPVYNVERYLKKCIESLIHQTYRNIEIILVDDGSTDRSKEICDAYAKEDFRIRVIHQENQGLSQTRRNGLEIAKADYVVFVDSDDYVDERFVEKLWKLMENNVDMALVGFKNIDETGKIVPIKPEKSEILEKEDMLDRFLLQKPYINAMWNKCYKKEILEKIDFPSGILFEDFAVIYRIIDQCGRIALSSETLYNYRIREDSIMTQEFTLKKMDLIKNSDDMKSYMYKFYPQKTSLIAYCDMYCCFTTLRRMVLSKKRYKEQEQELRIRALKDASEIRGLKEVTIKDKAGIGSLALGIPVFKMCWSIYERLKRK